MGKTKIEWTDRVWNVMTGCLGPRNDGVLCPYCYGKGLAVRFNNGDFDPAWHPERLDEPLRVKKPSRFFTGSVTDYFGNWVDQYHFNEILRVTARCPQHTFYMLTKQADHIACKAGNHARLYREYGWYNNVWLGVSVTCTADLGRIERLRDAWPGHKFVSFEPLIAINRAPDLQGIEWCIIGAMTGRGAKKHQPAYGDALSIMNAADKLGIPVFLKENLALPSSAERRQEFPK